MPCTARHLGRYIRYCTCRHRCQTTTMIRKGSSSMSQFPLMSCTFRRRSGSTCRRRGHRSPRCTYSQSQLSCPRGSLNLPDMPSMSRPGLLQQVQNMCRLRSQGMFRILPAPCIFPRRTASKRALHFFKSLQNLNSFLTAGCAGRF